MLGKGRWGLRFIIFIGIITGAGFLWGKTCEAEAKGNGYISLKKILEEPGEARIVLNANIRLNGTVYVRGKKQIIGNGHWIRRGNVSGKIFGGTMFCVSGGKLLMQDTIVSGGGTQNGNRQIYGRLIDVKKGTFILGQKSVLNNNCNTGRGEEGGGAVYVRGQGQFLMKSGEISGNQTVTEGAAVFVEKGGKFQMKGGIVQNNRSRGIGAIEGFDGRGGAIYNHGSVIISGGLIRCNYALSYLGKKSEYGGVGGMLFNRGSCVITGGTIEKNVSSYGGGAIYSDRNSTLRILGGNFRNNQAERGRTVFFCGQSCYLNVDMDKNEIYQENGCNIQKGNRIRTSNPEGTKKQLQTGVKKRFVWNTDQTKRVYYTGENLNEKTLLYGIHVKYAGKDISRKIKLTRISGVMAGSGKKPDTRREGKGRLFFHVFEDTHKCSNYSIPYVIKKNKRPYIRVAPRYLFTWEVSGYSQKRWKEILQEGICLEDTEDAEKDLRERAEFKLGNLTVGKAGTYRIQVTVFDQWGKRFYMKGNEKKQYGKGKEGKAEISVTLVSEDDSAQTEHAVVRFQPEYQMDETVQQEWHFSSELVGEIQLYLANSSDPFSEKTNDNFQKRFGFAQIKGG